MSEYNPYQRGLVQLLGDLEDHSWRVGCAGRLTGEVDIIRYIKSAILACVAKQTPPLSPNEKVRVTAGITASYPDDYASATLAPGHELTVDRVYYVGEVWWVSFLGIHHVAGHLPEGRKPCYPAKDFVRVASHAKSAA